MARTTKAIARALEHLSSGKRINSASEDASGLAISTGLTSQARSLTRSAQNINEAMSYLQTADSVVGSLSQIVQRIREVAVQASSGLLSDADRNNLNIEVQQLYAEYNRLVSQSDFNGTKLLDGTFGLKSVQAGSNSGDTISIETGNANNMMTQTVGTGTFASRTTIGIGTTPADLRAVDLDDDGYQDLVVRNSNGVGLYFGNADGTFSGRTTLVSNTPTSIDINDFDGDGKDDVVVATSTTVTFYKNKGARQFDSGQALTGLTSGNTSQVVSGDVNGDGKIDLIRSYGGPVVM